MAPLASHAARRHESFFVGSPAFFGPCGATRRLRTTDDRSERPVDLSIFAIARGVDQPGHPHLPGDRARRGQPRVHLDHHEPPARGQAAHRPQARAWRARSPCASSSCASRRSYRAHDRAPVHRRPRALRARVLGARPRAARRRRLPRLQGRRRAARHAQAHRAQGRALRGAQGAPPHRAAAGRGHHHGHGPRVLHRLGHHGRGHGRPPHHHDHRRHAGRVPHDGRSSTPSPTSSTGTPR